ncbi:methylmalonyl Co-A mutase-associated GTPase MeaB [Paludisphaera mucosa]|uniref:Methylmalonyl Co-A mutase-associated GTPase MeaB n=1 Tax=Paludisphaera mucosa TaxID=3030827 RepID=A0ABT6F7K3_9BACT|nr:methylmalonyl Co-A mutase-associated GTPase MeaB [Paludisphaera mucosa]MDG3003556.1 methylmalonyl Co-A mutase-associated GTPase MeaB [Paludisphaera mucosa]
MLSDPAEPPREPSALPAGPTDDDRPSKATLDEADRALVEGVLKRQPRALAKAITLVESTRSDHRRRAAGVLDALLPHTGRSIRLGISGSPGAGKSTFIEVLGLELIRLGHRVAVLAVDPSSSISGGSILGDKTRMERLSVDPDAYIRPSPSRGSLGGVADKTREAMLICEAAGFDVLLIETVGVGQSETTVAGMVDAFVLIQLPNAGDDLQAIKKGIVEVADLIVVNKADIDPDAAELARRQLAGALSLLRRPTAGWRPVVVSVSAARNQGIDKFWGEVERLRAALQESGELDEKRRRQSVDWMWSLIDQGLRSRFRENPRVRRELEPASRSVAEGRTTAAAAAYRLLDFVEAAGP